jgi:excisionase family DNA binding protein
MNDRVLYSITEARELLGKMSRNMIYDLLRSGELPSVVIGCRRYISAEAISELVKKSTTTRSPAIEALRSRPIQPSLGLLPPPQSARSRRRVSNS